MPKSHLADMAETFILSFLFDYCLVNNDLYLLFGIVVVLDFFFFIFFLNNTASLTKCKSCLRMEKDFFFVTIEQLKLITKKDKHDLFD